MRSLFVLFLLFPALVGKSQDSTDNHELDTSIYVTVHEKAEYPGGQRALIEYLSQNIEVEVTENQAVQSKYFFVFIIEKDGSISNVREIKKTEWASSHNGIEVLSTLPGKWKPAKIDGLSVRSEFKLPMYIHLR